MISSILKFFKALNSDVGPWQIAFAGAFALVIGLTPLWSLHNLIVLLLAFSLRVHLGTFFVFWGVFSLFAYLLDPWFHQTGLTLLTQPELLPTWQALYLNDFWQASRFNHTITLGSFVIAIVAFVPTAVIFRLSVNQYRASVMPWFDKLKVVQVLKGSRLFQLYEQIED